MEKTGEILNFQLLAKARAGSLMEAETQKLDSYLHIGNLWRLCNQKRVATYGC
jgi:hypothetical protein